MTSLENRIAIISAMEQLLAQPSLEEIKTKDICKLAGVSRQTFYRCFKDKYDAATWFMEEGARHSVRQIGVTCGWHTGYLRLFTFVARHHGLIERFFQTKGTSALGKTLMKRVLEQNSIRHFREQYIQATGNEPDPKIDFQIIAFSKMANEYISEWQATIDPPPSDEFVDMFLSVVPRDLYAALNIKDHETPFLHSWLLEEMHQATR